MKRFTGMLLAFAFLLLGTLATAATNFDNLPEEPRIVTEALDYKVIKVRLVNLQQEMTIVQIQDMSGREYYKRVIKDHNGFARRLDLKDLENGRYMLKIKQDDQEWVQVVLVADDAIRMSGMVLK
jgi:hypothetical protein